MCIASWPPCPIRLTANFFPALLYIKAKSQKLNCRSYYAERDLVGSGVRGCTNSRMNLIAVTAKRAKTKRSPYSRGLSLPKTYKGFCKKKSAQIIAMKCSIGQDDRCRELQSKPQGRDKYKRGGVSPRQFSLYPKESPWQPI